MLLYTCSLTVDDFYKDADADTIETLPAAKNRVFSYLLNLPIHISNLKDFHTVGRHVVSDNCIRIISCVLFTVL